jgi:hypothetical protein
MDRVKLRELSTFEVDTKLYFKLQDNLLKLNIYLYSLLYTLLYAFFIIHFIIHVSVLIM